jgi:hypothetical protein
MCVPSKLEVEILGSKVKVGGAPTLMYNKILKGGNCKVKVCSCKVKVYHIYINKTSHSISLHKSVPSVIFVLTSPPLLHNQG